MRWLLIGIGVVVVLYGLRRLAVVAEDRSPIFYRQRPPRIQSLVESGQGDPMSDGYRDGNGSG